MESKLEILRRFDASSHLTDIARDFGLANTTVITMCNNKETIMVCAWCVTSSSAVKITKARSSAMENTECLLSVWIESQTSLNVPVNTMVIKEKAKSLFEDLNCSESESSTMETFGVSDGWFSRFKRRYSLQSLKVTGEASSADKAAANCYPEELKKSD